MKILIQWEVHPDRRDEVIATFAGMSLEDYQAQFGPNVTTLCRFHDLANCRGFAVVESTDQDALVRVLTAWNSSVDFELSLVYDDAEAHSLARELTST